MYRRNPTLHVLHKPAAMKRIGNLEREAVQYILYPLQLQES